MICLLISLLLLLQLTMAAGTSASVVFSISLIAGELTNSRQPGIAQVYHF